MKGLWIKRRWRAVLVHKIHSSGCCTGKGARRLDNMVLMRGHVAPPPGPNPSNDTSAATKRPRADRLAGTATDSAPAPRAACDGIDYAYSVCSSVHQTSIVRDAAASTAQCAGEVPIVRLAAAINPLDSSEC